MKTLVHAQISVHFFEPNVGYCWHVCNGRNRLNKLVNLNTKQGSMYVSREGEKLDSFLIYIGTVNSAVGDQNNKAS